ncbi:unnamed protein product [Peronospora farinosa]|uniref:Uncharacterized protein n=1 Tax=Peronospora farinosa TaxID=134698 RepID=A0ABN8BZJ9_9STRA|nr:unnamed protein product [Peronospora farinosa]
MALESIQDEDRYFHPSRYVLARIVCLLSTFYSTLEHSGSTCDSVLAFVDAVRAHRVSCFMRVASQLQEMLDTLEGAGGIGGIGGSGDDASTQTQLHGESRSVDGLFKQLAKTYTYYLEVFHAQHRLTHAIDDYELLRENAELPMVAVFLLTRSKANAAAVTFVIPNTTDVRQSTTNG